MESLNSRNQTLDEKVDSISVNLNMDYGAHAGPAQNTCLRTQQALQVPNIHLIPLTVPVPQVILKLHIIQNLQVIQVS